MQSPFFNPVFYTPIEVENGDRKTGIQSSFFDPRFLHTHYHVAISIVIQLDAVEPPGPTLPPPSPWDCTFEGGDLCSWSQGTNDDFDWTIQTGSTPTIGTGPPADHTTQTKDGENRSRKLKKLSKSPWHTFLDM